MSNPRVSVVMPVYNAEPYVAEAIESILSQTYRDFEFLVFDDGSTDRSLEILRTYAARDNRMRMFRKPHRGYVPWLNEGMKLSRGEFIARMDADDISLENRLKHQVSYLNDNPGCVGVGCDLIVIDNNGRTLGVLNQEKQPKIVEDMLLKGIHGVIAHPTCMMRRETLLTIGGYRAEFEPIEDLDLWLRLLERGKLANIPQTLFKYRLNPTGACSTRFRKQQYHANFIITEARSRRGLRPLKYGSQLPIHPSNDEVAALQLRALLMLGIGNRRLAIGYALQSLYKEPLSASSWATLCWITLPFFIRRVINLIRRWA